jgi:hypothetical protein
MGRPILANKTKQKFPKKRTTVLGPPDLPDPRSTRVSQATAVNKSQSTAVFATVGTESVFVALFLLDQRFHPHGNASGSWELLMGTRPDPANSSWERVRILGTPHANVCGAGSQLRFDSVLAY